MAAPSQTLPMVDDRRGGLYDPSIMRIGHHLVFRAGGLSEWPDARSAPPHRVLSGVRVRIGCIASTLRTGHSCDDLNSWPRSPHTPECSQLFRSSQLCPPRSHPPRPKQPTTPIEARGKTTSSKNQVMTYPCCVGILKHSPPTVYHGQGLA